MGSPPEAKEYENVLLLSGSDVVIAPTNVPGGEFSATAVPERVMPVGGLLCPVTWIVKMALKDRPP